MAENIQKINIKVWGRVQGVFFRRTTQEIAKDLHLKGLVKNKGVDSVEIIAEGEKKDLEKLIEWAKKGPLWARVEKIQVIWQNPENKFKEFKIEY